ncbi:hypothetical protein [Epibacterium sp. Ofav1-8]|uniref:hypothetical protein n=1 Tax=Epibacterium sp. Ofav1-8 TaxID=2917735 RepID=UPI001EF6A708|nr:hypothetical protein [Epibacterium sp. Ofav1-8]MCG7625173.1 hypothetical protein [Epibacterium sp. Ofav1-8]
MTSRHLQTGLALIFLVLGGWCLIAPAMVVRFAFQPEFNEATQQARFIMGCFGAQAVLNGTLLLTARFTPMTFLVFGLVGSVAVFVFNVWFWLVEPILNAWMLLDPAGNIGILSCGLWGWALARREQTQAGN